MDRNVSDAVGVAQIAAESNESITMGIVLVVFAIVLFLSMD